MIKTLVFFKNIFIVIYYLLKTVSKILINYNYNNDLLDDLNRIKIINDIINFLMQISEILNKNIIYLNESKIILSDQITIINTNHTHQSDIFVILDIFRRNNIEGLNISSLSTTKGTSKFDRKILELLNSVIVNGNSNDIKNIIEGLELLKLRKYKTTLITFFEGITKMDYKGQSNLKNLIKPKIIGFNTINKEINSKFMYDINIVYTFKNKIIKDKKYFLLKLLHPQAKIYVQISKYKLPNKENSIKWINSLYEHKDKQIDKIIEKTI